MEQKRDARGRFLPEDGVYATGIKGFQPGLVCEPAPGHKKQYKENTVFEEKGGEICGPGVMHAADTAADVLDYVPLIDRDGALSEFARVEALAPVQRKGNKWSTTKMRVGKKLGLKAFIEQYITDIREMRAKKASLRESLLYNLYNGSLIGNFGPCIKLASSGGWTQIASSGNDAQIVNSGGWAQIASSGNEAQIASSGNGIKIVTSGARPQIASSGNEAQIANSGNAARISNSGDKVQIITSGNWTQINSSGDETQIGNSGNNTRIVSSDKSAKISSSGCSAIITSLGSKSVVAAIGQNSTVSAELGSWITLAEYAENGDCLCVKSAKIDGVKLKPGISYKLENGEFKEVK